MTGQQVRQRYDQARKLYQQGKYAESLALLDKLEQTLTEDDKKVMLARARCLAKLGRLGEAREVCERETAVFGDPYGLKLAGKLGLPETAAPPPAVPSRRSPGWPFYLAGGALVVVVAAGLVGYQLLGRRDKSPVTTVVQAVEKAPGFAQVPGPPAPTPEPAQGPPGAPKPSLSPKLRLDTMVMELEETSQDEMGFSSEPKLKAPGSLRFRNPLKTAGGDAGMPSPALPREKAAGPATTLDHGKAAQAAAPYPLVASVMDLQPFKTQQRLTNARGDEVILTNLNPNVGAWYLLEVNVGGQKNTLHLEAPAFDGNPQNRPALSLYADGLAVSIKNRETRHFPLWAGDAASGAASNAPVNTAGLNPAPGLLDIIKPGHTFPSPFTVFCDGLVLIRTQKPGSTTKLESATDLLRETRLGDWFVEKAKPYLIPAPELAEDHRGTTASEHAVGETYPQDALVDERQITLYCTPQGLGIETDAADKKLFYGRWYKAVHHPHVFVGIMKPTVADKTILSSYPDRVGVIGTHDKKRREAEALVYLVAYDLSHFKLGFALGAEHPKLDWSPRINGFPITAKGPDGFDSRRPLCTIGALAPYCGATVAGAFAGGFKREHGAFKVGPLAGFNNGNHFGFMEQGTIFSRLQPRLASIVIGLDGAIDMVTWPEDASPLLATLAHVRQNCVPVIEGRDKDGLSIPGRYVNDWGAGAWSGDQAGDLVTLRAGVALQEFEGRRFLLFAYFTGATPNAMARTFQAYRCRYAMLLDMNTPNYCYAALYLRDNEGKITGAEHLHRDMASGNGGDGSLKFLQTNDTRDFFYVLRNP